MVDETITAALERGATVLTGNQRAARILRKAVDERNRDLGTVSWTPAAVLPWSAWTAGLWRRLLLSGATGKMLLNRAQEHALWREVIAEDESLTTLRSSESLAQLAAEAWAALARYRGLGRLQGSATNGDTRSFVRWAESFEERCRAKDYLAEPRLEGVLRKAVLAGTLEVQELVLIGFDRLLPAQNGLIEAFRAMGTKVELPVDGPLPESRYVAVAEDEDGEIWAAARWARSQVEEHPGVEVGIVVPGLSDLRSRIDRIFRAVLAPERQNIASGAGGCPYEFSSGGTLSATPMVACALDLLGWVDGDGVLARERVSDLMLSPYMGGAGEEGARAEFDAFELRKARLLLPELSLGWLVAKIAGSRQRTERLTRLSAALRGMQHVAGRRLAAGERRSHGDWAEAMREILAAALWASRPGEDSVEFQTRERWESTLDELATLDFDGMRVSYGEALAALRRITQEAVFAPESRDAPVQILGPEESTGQRFDAIWFLRAADRSWPPPISGNPLIGWPLRRELGVPGSSAAADAAQAVRVTRRIAGCATKEIVFSYARQSAEGEQRPLVTLAGLDLEEVEADPGALDEAAVRLEAMEDVAAIPRMPDRLVRGGVSVLKAQAACAFRAFAEHRLFSSALEEREMGQSASERGIAVHEVLESFWAEVKTQAALKGMTTEARKVVLGRCADAAMAKAAKDATTAWDGAYLETQRDRLVLLGTAWLEMEAARRTPFAVVQHETREQDIAIGPLRLTLQVDRVDEIAEGSVLIDYKTGEVTPASWLTDRPDEPQLPLYAVLAKDLRLEAIAFGKVRPGEGMALAGYENAPGTLTKQTKMKAESLEAQVEAWRAVLTALAEDFVGGDTRVSPKAYPKTCAFCQQRLICRLEAGSLEIDEDDGESQEDRNG